MRLQLIAFLASLVHIHLQASSVWRQLRTKGSSLWEAHLLPKLLVLCLLHETCSEKTIQRTHFQGKRAQFPLACRFGASWKGKTSFQGLNRALLKIFPGPLCKWELWGLHNNGRDKLEEKIQPLTVENQLSVMDGIIARYKPGAERPFVFLQHYLLPSELKKVYSPARRLAMEYGFGACQLGEPHPVNQALEPQFSYLFSEMGLWPGPLALDYKHAVCVLRVQLSPQHTRSESGFLYFLSNSVCFQGLQGALVCLF